MKSCWVPHAHRSLVSLDLDPGSHASCASSSVRSEGAIRRSAQFFEPFAMEYAVAAFDDKIYAARLAYNSRTATELRREAATMKEKLRAAGELRRAAAAALTHVCLL